ncbi:hypothetical protein PN471_19655 [Aphanizomenon sp. CS-733/32]|jgi:hypothetical protein|nr:hypothetical protein [Aphanizomenon sp. CS-733/32]MDB9310799.1 hypothetical protein [Aphanizomenon sp. CS-733/32]
MFTFHLGLLYQPNSICTISAVGYELDWISVTSATNSLVLMLF